MKAGDYCSKLNPELRGIEINEGDLLTVRTDSNSGFYTVDVQTHQGIDSSYDTNLNEQLYAALINLWEIEEEYYLRVGGTLKSWDSTLSTVMGDFKSSVRGIGFEVYVLNDLTLVTSNKVASLHFKSEYLEDVQVINPSRFGSVCFHGPSINEVARRFHQWRLTLRSHHRRIQADLDRLDAIFSKRPSLSWHKRI